MPKNEEPKYRAMAAQLVSFGLLELSSVYNLQKSLVHQVKVDELSIPDLQDTILNRKANCFYLCSVNKSTRIHVRFYKVEN